MIALQSLIMACSRAPATAASPAAQSQAAVVSMAAPAEDKPAVAMQPVLKKTPTTKAPVASSLAGIDRHLADRPFDTVDAGDFVLGQLLDESNDLSLSATLDATTAALVKGTLPYGRLSSGTAVVARALYEQRLRTCAPILAVRFAERQPVPGGSVAIRFRILADTPAHSSQGLLVVDRAESGALTIEHLELDLDSLNIERAREQPWDPYGTSQP